MAITRPDSFTVLPRAGLGAVQREQVIGLREEWEANVDNSQHHYAFLARESLINWAGTPKPSSSTPTERYLFTTNTSGSPKERFAVPYEISNGRSGTTSAHINVQCTHRQGSVRFRIMNEARSATYSTLTLTNNSTSQVTHSGILSLSSGSSGSGLLVVDHYWNGTHGSEHRIHSLYVQVGELALGDMS